MWWIKWVTAIEAAVFAVVALFDGDVSNIYLLTAEEKECCADLWATDALLPKSCTLDGALQCWDLSFARPTTVRSAPSATQKRAMVVHLSSDSTWKVSPAELVRPPRSASTWYWRALQFFMKRIARRDFGMPFQFPDFILAIICALVNGLVGNFLYRRGDSYKVTLRRAVLLTTALSLVKLSSGTLSKEFWTRYIGRLALTEPSTVFDKFAVWNALAAGLVMHLMVFLPLQRYFRPSRRVMKIIWFYVFAAHAVPQVLLWSDLLCMEAFALCFEYIFVSALWLWTCWEIIDLAGFWPADPIEAAAA